MLLIVRLRPLSLPAHPIGRARVVYSHVHCHMRRRERERELIHYRWENWTSRIAGGLLKPLFSLCRLTAHDFRHIASTLTPYRFHVIKEFSKHQNSMICRVSVPGAFKLDHLHPFKPILF